MPNNSQKYFDNEWLPLTQSKRHLANFTFTLAYKEHIQLWFGLGDEVGGGGGGGGEKRALSTNIKL